MKSTKGLSNVVTTLIFILLAIVAIGIVWYIFGNLSQSTQDQIAIGEKCIGLDLRPVGVDANCGAGNATCVVEVSRGIGSSEEIKGVRVVIIGNTNSTSTDILGDIPVSATVSKNAAIPAGITGDVEQVTVTGYFEINGVDQYCQNPQSYEIQ